MKGTCYIRAYFDEIDGFNFDDFEDRQTSQPAM